MSKAIYGLMIALLCSSCASSFVSYVCNGHSTARIFGEAGTCLECGSELVPALTDSGLGAGIQFACWQASDGHEVVTGGPGACPICGVALKPIQSL